MIKLIPNSITIIRIILSLVLIIIKPFSLFFYIVYFLCGFSDMIDGFIARKTNSTSSLGEKLDSIADMVMIGSLFCVFLPYMLPFEFIGGYTIRDSNVFSSNLVISKKILIWILIIFIIKIISIFIGFIKYKALVMYHSYANKATGFILFVTPFLLLHINTNILYAICCIAASLAAIEELTIQVMSMELRVNCKSVLHIKDKKR